MNNLFISYDLMKPGQDYTAIADAIKSLGAWAKVHYSLYYLSTSLTAEQVRDFLRTACDSNDKVIVIEATDALWHNLPDEVILFIKQRW